jgi:hypothetical protein
VRETADGQAVNVEPGGNKVDVVGYARAREVQLAEAVGTPQATAG